MSLAIRISIVFCVALLATLLGVIWWAAGQEGLGDGLRRLITEPWGVVTLIDLYAGFAFFAAWLWVVEKSRAAFVLWLILLFCFGNAATLLYLTFRARKSRQFADLFLPGRAETA